MLFFLVNFEKNVSVKVMIKQHNIIDREIYVF